MSAKLIWLFLLTIFLALLQNTNLLIFYGIKPNLVLVFLIALSFFITDIFIYLYFVLVGVIFLGFEQLAIALPAILSFAVGRRLHWQPFFNNLLLVSAGTIVFYLLVGWSSVVLGEIIYNLVVGSAFFALIEKCLKTNSILKM
jgi:hypothetical protein